MLTKQQALEFAANALQTHCYLNDDVAVLKEDSTIDTEFGWAFFYNSKRFMETGVNRFRLAGNGPILVNKFDGTIKFCGSARPPRHYIEEFAAQWAEKQRSEPY